MLGQVKVEGKGDHRSDNGLLEEDRQSNKKSPVHSLVESKYRESFGFYRHGRI